MGWKYTGEDFAGLEIYKKGKERRLVKPDGEVVIEYKSKFD